MKPQAKLIGTTITALSVLGSAGLAFAADSNTGPFRVQASLLTPARISLGEPILIRYELMNVSPQNALTHLGIYGTDWYTLTLRDTQGAAVPLLPDTRPAHPRGAYSSKSGFCRPGTSDIDYVPVTQRLSIPHPGAYTLTLHVRLPYVTGDTVTEGTPEGVAISSNQVQTQDIVFPLLVTPADPVRLRSVAESLRAASAHETDGNLARAEMDGLFSMPEAQAAVTWRTMALKPNAYTELVAGELENLGTATAADILAEMLDAPGLVCTPVSDRLSRMYKAGTPTLRQYIKGIAAQHGFEMAEAVGSPVVLD